jgi:N-acetylneuraminate epimerase
MLIVAGGANFPGKPPWEGGTKVWHDEIYGWKPGDLNWRLLGHLPQASAYGVSVSTPQGMICVGGSTASNHLRSCYQLRFEKDRMVFVPLPDLPTSIANGCGAVLDGVLYLAGGQETPGSQMALASFWALDLNQPEGHWELLASWPGPPRILGLAGVLQDSFLLIGGAELEGTSNQTTKRRYLKDAYAYRPSHGWEPLPDLPWSIVAAPSPALTLDPFTLLILGGDDGSLLETDPRNHPGFFKRSLQYHARERTWAETAPPPIARVTTQTTILDGHWVIPSGETRPGVRSAEVWSMKIPGNDHR